MIIMKSHDFSAPEAGRSIRGGLWRTLPISGVFDIVYEDRAGSWTSRAIQARELKLGPGRTLLGGLDLARGLYRGFRVDRIRRLTDHATGERIEAGILDRLFMRAKAEAKVTSKAASAAASKAEAKPRRGTRRPPTPLDVAA